MKKKAHAMGAALSTVGVIPVDEQSGTYVQWIEPRGGKLLGFVRYQNLHYQIGESVVDSAVWFVPRVIYFPFHIGWQFFIKFTFFSGGISLFFFTMLFGFALCWLIFWSLSDFRFAVDVIDIIFDVPITVANTAVFGVNYLYGMFRPIIPFANSLFFNGLRLLYTVGVEVSTAIDTIADQIEKSDGLSEDGYGGSSSVLMNMRQMAKPIVANASLAATQSAVVSSFSMFTQCYRRANNGLTVFEDPLCGDFLSGDRLNSARMYMANVMVNTFVLVVKVIGFLIRGLMWAIFEGVLYIVGFFMSTDFIGLFVWAMQEVGQWLVNAGDALTSLSTYTNILFAVVGFFGNCISNPAMCIMAPVNEFFAGWFSLRNTVVKRSATHSLARQYIKNARYLTPHNTTSFHLPKTHTVTTTDIDDTLAATLEAIRDRDITNNTWCGSTLLTWQERAESQQLTNFEALPYGEQWGITACLVLYVADTVSHMYMHTEPGTFLSPIKMIRGLANLMNSSAPEWLRLETEINKFDENFDQTKSTMGRMYKTFGSLASGVPLYVAYDEREANSDKWDTNTRFVHNTAVSVMRGLRAVEHSTMKAHVHTTRMFKHKDKNIRMAHAKKSSQYLRQTSHAIRQLTGRIERDSTEQSAQQTAPWSLNMRYDEEASVASVKQHVQARRHEQAQFASMKQKRGEMSRRGRLASASDSTRLTLGSLTNSVLAWLSTQFEPNRPGGVPFMDLFDPSKLVNRVMNTADCWQGVDFSCDYSEASAEDDASPDAAMQKCKTSCADAQAKELGEGSLTLESVGERAEQCLANCIASADSNSGFIGSVADGLGGFLQMCWPPNRNGVPMSDERLNNETQCFPQIDELFHMEYIDFNFENWVLATTASENVESVCSIYSLEVWEECSPKGMLIGACFYLFDWVPIYVGITKAFANKVSNVFTALEYFVLRLLLQIPSDTTQVNQDMQLVCFWVVGLWSMLWSFLICMLLVFVFVVFDDITFAFLNMVLSPVYIVLTFVNALPPLPVAQRNEADDAIAKLTLASQRERKSN